MSGSVYFVPNPTQEAALQRIEPRARLSVDDLAQLQQAGALPADARYELVDGELIEMALPGGWHYEVVGLITEVFVEAVRRGAYVMVQSPVRLDEHNFSVPDLSLVRRDKSYLRQGSALPGDVLLAVEVSDTSASKDLGRKALQLAGYGVPELWVIDRERQRVVALWDPSPLGYESRRVAARGEALSPRLLPAVSLSVDDLLGPA